MALGSALRILLVRPEPHALRVASTLAFEILLMLPSLVHWKCFVSDATPSLDKATYMLREERAFTPQKVAAPDSEEYI